MSVLINKNICDNAKECGGIAVCPTKAIFWDDDKKTIAIDNEKCISCGLCEENCPVGAIHVAHDQSEYEKIKLEIDNDPRKIADLFVDRYGAAPVGKAFLYDQSQFKTCAEESNVLTFIELFKNETAECLIHSIPIKELFENNDYNYRKIDVVDDSLLSEYKISKLPCLMIFNKSKYLGHVEGHFTPDKKPELIAKIKQIVNSSINE